MGVFKYIFLTIKNDLIEERKRRSHGENKIIYYSAWKNHV